MSTQDFTEVDVYTLIGTAHEGGSPEMRAYFMELAHRIALQIGDRALADRCVELRSKLPKASS